MSHTRAHRRIRPWPGARRAAAVGCLSLWQTVSYAAVLAITQTATEDGLVAIQVAMTPGTGESVAGAQFEIPVDTALFEVYEVVAGAAALAAGKDVAFSAHEDALTVLVAGFNQSGIEAGALATIYLSPATPETSSATFSLRSGVLADPSGQSVPVEFPAEPKVETPTPGLETPPESPASEAGPDDADRSSAAGSGTRAGARGAGASDELEPGKDVSERRGGGPPSAGLPGTLRPIASSNIVSGARAGSQTRAGQSSVASREPQPGPLARRDPRGNMESPLSGTPRMAGHETAQPSSDTSGAMFGVTPGVVTPLALPAPAREAASRLEPGRTDWRKPALFVAILGGFAGLAALRRRIRGKG